MPRFPCFVLFVVLAGCAPKERERRDPGPPPECTPRRGDAAPIVVDEGGTDPPRGDSVWGAADLHVHPAGHLVMGGRDDGSGGVLFGRPDPARQEHGRVWVGPEDSCDGETHLRATPDVATRLTQSLVFSILGGEGRRAHTAMHARTDGPHEAELLRDGGAPRDAGRAGDAGTSRACIDAGEVPDIGTPSFRRNSPFESWPHGQDIYHQQMYVEMVRRAWEGGLRLMFASITDNQSLARVMGITVAPGPLELDPSFEVESVERQLAFIESVVRDNSDFMAIVTSPGQARDVIRGGRLAVVLALEMDWLPIEEVRRLRDQHGFRSIIPIHVADNPVGGAAAYTPVFNMHSALYSRAFGAPELEYFELMRDSCLLGRAAPPLRPNLELGLLLLPTEMPAAEYLTLGYESCDTCASGSPRPVDLRGHRNARGLRNTAYVRELMRMGMLVDVVHMSIAAASDTLAEAERWDYPVIDTHTGVSHAGERVGFDRDLPMGLARRIYRNRHGIVGLGTRGGEARVLDTIYHGEGAPLASLQPGVVQRLDVPTCAAFCTGEEIGPASRVCVTPPPACDGCRLGLVRARFCDGSGVDLELSDEQGAQRCTDALGARAASIASLELRMAREGWCGVCASEGCEGDYVSHDCDAAEAAATRPVLRTGGDDCALRFPAGGSSDALSARPVELLERPCDRVACFGPATLEPDPAPRERAVVPGRHVLRIRAIPEAGFTVRTRGSSAFYQGADVLVTLGIAEIAEPITVSLNHGGLWIGDTEYDEYVVVDSAEPELHLTGVWVSMQGSDPRPYPWKLASLRVDVIEDPVLAWARNYAQLREEVAAASTDAPEMPPTDVVFAIGTDMNGFAPQFPVSASEPRDACVPFEMCSTETGVCQPLTLRQRGLANYALLADFFAALPDEVADAVLSSADATIRVWEHAEARAGSVPR